MAIPKSGWSDVSAEVKNDYVMYLFDDNQTKTIYNKDPFVKKDPKLVNHYKLPIEYKLWEKYPKLKQKYKIGSHHKMDDMVFEVVDYEKNMCQDIIIVFKEAENIGMTGPNDHLMAGIGVNHDPMKDDLDLFDPNNPMDEVTLDKLTITVPKEEDYPFKVTDAVVPLSSPVCKRSQRSKMFYELTHRESECV